MSFFFKKRVSDLTIASNDYWDREYATPSCDACVLDSQRLHL